MRETRQPADQPAAPDAFHGLGGSYLIDPDTGARVLIARTDHQPETEAPDADAAES